MGLAYGILSIYLFKLAVVDSMLPFVYMPGSSADPTQVALLRMALMYAGISPHGIILKSILSKNEIFRTSYKAVYINELGQTCFLKWRVNAITGTQSPKMPVCENVATGSGPNPPIVRPLVPIFDG